MKYAKLITNDVVNGENICVSLFVQGCHKHCPGCFNKETWNFNGGKEISIQGLTQQIITAIGKNNIQRNFSVLGGDSFAPENLTDIIQIVTAVKEKYPNIKVWVWTGYTIEELKARKDNLTNAYLSLIDVLIDGPYIESERDLSLPYRGSRNQRIIQLK